MLAVSFFGYAPPKKFYFLLNFFAPALLFFATASRGPTKNRRIKNRVGTNKRAVSFSLGHGPLTHILVLNAFTIASQILNPLLFPIALPVLFKKVKVGFFCVPFLSESKSKKVRSLKKKAPGGSFEAKRKKNCLAEKNTPGGPFGCFARQGLGNFSRGTLLPIHPQIKYPLGIIQTSLKNNIILEIWTNGSIHPRQALYDACKNLLSIFSKLEK